MDNRSASTAGSAMQQTPAEERALENEHKEIGGS